MRNTRQSLAGVLLVGSMTVASLTGCAARSSRAPSTAPECPERICPSLAALVDSNALQPGHDVRVLDSTGAKLTGTLLGLSATEVVVRVNDAEKRLAERDVLGIWRRAGRGRSMAGYAAVGAVVGLGWGSVAWLSKRQVDCTEERADLVGDCFVHDRDYFVVPTTGLAILGAGVGVFLRGERQVFAGTRPPTAVVIRPQVDRHRKGIQLAVAF